MTGPAFDGSFEFVEHTADIAVRLRAREVSGLFAAAAAAFTEAVTDGVTVVSREPRAVRLAAPDLEMLLVDWLHELLFLFETESFLVREAEVGITCSLTRTPIPDLEAQESDLRDLPGLRELRDEYVISATLHGERRDPARHPLKLLIKAVTYHGLHITESGEGYEATVIFDI